MEIAFRGRDGTGNRGDVFWGSETVFASDPVVMDVTLPQGVGRLQLFRLALACLQSIHLSVISDQ
jgi:sensor domain CHASE-containing protein